MDKMKEAFLFAARTYRESAFDRRVMGLSLGFERLADGISAFFLEAADGSQILSHMPDFGRICAGSGFAEAASRVCRRLHRMLSSALEGSGAGGYAESAAGLGRSPQFQAAALVLMSLASVAAAYSDRLPYRFAIVFAYVLAVSELAAFACGRLAGSLPGHGGRARGP